MLKTLVFAGTRPEAIKLAPLVLELERRPLDFAVRLCATGQHREMLQQALADFGLTPDFNLQVMTPNQTLATLTSQLFTAIDALLEKERPDLIIVQGDTTTVMVAATCAFYRNIPVGHVEAGLRSHDLQAPFPEEFNRRVASLTAALHFCPTALARDNLLAEGVAAEAAFITGNTGVDALLHMVREVRARPRRLPEPVMHALAGGRRVVLITGHRRESFGQGFRDICLAVRRLAERFPDVRFIYPVHLNPNVQEPVRMLLGDCPGVMLCSPLAYQDFVQLMDASRLILSDSGGIQEEAPSLGKPVLVMREVTERPEGVRAGTSRLVGTDQETIVSEVARLLTDQAYYDGVARIKNPYGDGRAAKRIADILAGWARNGHGQAP